MQNEPTHRHVAVAVLVNVPTKTTLDRIASIVDDALMLYAGIGVERVEVHPDPAAVFSDDGWVGYEARCETCGETFNPHGPDDLEHAVRENGTPCGSRGVLVGSWR
jgi:hypothetical protein